MGGFCWGDLIFQVKVWSVPSGSLLSIFPLTSLSALRVTLVCSATEILFPGSAMGGVLTGSTVISTMVVDVACSTSLSVTVNSNSKTEAPSVMSTVGVVNEAKCGV